MSARRKVLVSVVRLARPLTRKKTPKRVLALPDLEHAESAVLSRRRSVQRGYRPQASATTTTSSGAPRDWEADGERPAAVRFSADVPIAFDA